MRSNRQALRVREILVRASRAVLGRGAQWTDTGSGLMSLDMLEQRRLLSGLGIQYFSSTTPGAAPSESGTVSDINQSFSSNPITSDQTPFHVLYSGNFTIPSGDAGTYYFQLPAAEGATLTIDGQKIIYAPSIQGDDDLDGSVSFNDFSILLANYGSTEPATWADGDFDGDGSVGFNDLSLLLAAYGSTVEPMVIDNAGDDNPYNLPSDGIYLSAGQHDLQLDYNQFNYDENSSSQYPAAQLLWSTSPTGPYSDLSDLSLSPYPSPSGLNATYSTSGFQLNWTGASGASSYNVYESTSPDFYAVPANLLGSTTGTSYDVSTPGSGTAEYFMVTSVNGLGEESPASNQVSVNDDSQSYLSGLQVQVDGSGNDLITGSFSAGTADRTIHVDNSAGTEIATIDGSDLPYSFTGVASGDAVTAWVSDSEGDAWNPSTTTAATASGSISGTVYNDANMNGTQDSGEAGLDGATVFIDLNHDGTDDSGDPTTTTDSSGDYSFSGLFTGVDYTVQAVSPSGYAGETVYGVTNDDGSIDTTIGSSGSATGVSFGEVRTLAAPEDLTATSSSSSEVDLSWTDPNGGSETGFHIEYSVDGGTFTVLDTVAAGSTSYSATGLDLTEHDYVFRVAAYDTNGDSYYSNTADANAPQPGSQGIIVTGIQATAVADAGSVTLTWTSADDCGYDIYRSDSASSPLATISPSTTLDSDGTDWDYTYTDTSITSGDSYTYTLVPFNTLSGPGASSTSAGSGQQANIITSTTLSTYTEIGAWNLTADLPLPGADVVMREEIDLTPPEIGGSDPIAAYYQGAQTVGSDLVYYPATDYPLYAGIGYNDALPGVGPSNPTLPLPSMPVYNHDSLTSGAFPGFAYLADDAEAAGWGYVDGISVVPVISFGASYGSASGLKTGTSAGAVNATFFYST